MKKVLVILICCMVLVPSFGCAENIRDYNSVSHKAPVLMGESVSFSLSGSDVVYKMWIKSMLNGAEAEKRIKEFPTYTEFDEAPDGKEYYVVTVSVSATAPTEQRTTIAYEDFEFVTSDGVVKKTNWYTSITDDLILYTDGNGELNITFLADTDSSPLLLYAQSLWFSLGGNAGA